jgi:opacity protein-like surface antigen
LIARGAVGHRLSHPIGHPRLCRCSALTPLLLLFLASCKTSPILDRSRCAVDVLAGYQQITSQEEGDASGGQAQVSVLWPGLGDPFELGFMLGYGHDTIRVESAGIRQDLELNEILLGGMARVNFPLTECLIPFLDVSIGGAYVHDSGEADMDEVLGTDVLDHEFAAFAQVGAGTRFFLSDHFALELAVRYRSLGAFTSGDGNDRVDGFAALIGASLLF